VVKKRARRKHVPQRTCIACRTMRPKRELIRVVRTPEGEVLVDERGKRNGRGTYLCPQRSCWERALARGLLSAALRTSLSEEAVARLHACAKSLPERLDEMESVRESTEL